MPVSTLKSAGPGFHVLVVDDESRLCDMLVRSTTEMGFTTTACRSASQALKLLAADGSFDIVLLDLNLPGMSGLELFQSIRDRWPQIQVIVLTGFGNLEAARKAIRLDVVDFLIKPCPLGELERALAKAREQRLEALRESGILPTAIEPSADISSSDVRPNPALSLDDVERVHILAALDRHDGNRAAAAAELGISERTLYYRLGQYQRQRLA